MTSSKSGASHPPACLDIERVVQPRRHARHCDPLLSRASPPDAARAEDDHRRRRRHRSRSACAFSATRPATWCSILSVAAPAPLAGAVRPVVDPLSALLSAKSSQPALRLAPSALVRAKPSGRGFRRDLRGVAHAAFELAHALCRLAGAQEAGICRRADGRDRRQKPLLTRAGAVDPLSRLTQTLAEHYEKKRAHYAIDYPKIYDRDLRRIFSADPRHRRSPAASAFLRRNRARIRQIVSRWTGEYQLTLDAVLRRYDRALPPAKLRAVGSERQLRMEFIVLLTAKTVHSLYSPSRRQWIAL